MCMSGFYINSVHLCNLDVGIHACDTDMWTTPGCCTPHQRTLDRGLLGHLLPS